MAEIVVSEIVCSRRVWRAPPNLSENSPVGSPRDDADHGAMCRPIAYHGTPGGLTSDSSRALEYGLFRMFWDVF